MLTLKKVAVTGGLSSGKSTVCRMFQELGAYVVSADQVVHQLLSSNTVVGQQVISLLGSEIVKNQGLDRDAIANKVFSHPHLLKELEQILHPAVFDEIEKLFQKVKNEKTHTLFIAEIPLLYEAGMESLYDDIIAVEASPHLCKQRYLQSRPTQEAQFERRTNRQLPSSHKSERAQWIIRNNGSLDELRMSVKKIYNHLCKR